ncbi:transposase family protein [Spiroplasma poulsonii]|uniref:transposase family protein n=1 Tax=Spiroplasma poulsonii TaxID=2138 RepID=UPI001F4C7492|nr:transposase family protein [Spiroplasma poulsonii]UNF62256.1 transposase family protein [Spiroplasma poulsonii]
MLDILKVAEIEKFKKGGKTNKLSLENRLLMTLLYWREYQTYFHLVKVLILVRLSYRNIKWIGKIFNKKLDFQQLAGKKALINDYFNYYYWCYRNLNQTPKKKRQKQSILWYKRKTHDQNTSTTIEQETKNYNKFFAWKKNMIMLCRQRIKNPNFKNTKLQLIVVNTNTKKNHTQCSNTYKETKKTPLNKEQK